MSTRPSKIIHANCVSVDGSGVLILGASGSGKSTLTLELLNLGADLISDDRTVLTPSEHNLHAESPASIRGLIEVWGLGILTFPSVQNAKIVAAIDLDQIESERIPPVRMIEILGCRVPCLSPTPSPTFPIALLHYLRFGRQDEP